MLIKTQKSLLIGFQILLAKIHLYRAQRLWDTNGTEKALTHYDGLLKNAAFLQLARTQPGNVQKAIADIEEPCGHFSRSPCTASPPLVSAAVPRAVLQPWSDTGPLEPGDILLLTSKSSGPFDSRSYSTRLFVKSLNEQRSQTQCLTSNFPP